MYTRGGNMLQFFRPVLAVAANVTNPLCAVDIGANSGTHGEFICVRRCKVKTLLFIVSLEAVSGTTTAPTVVFTKRVTPGSDTSAVAMGTLTIPSGTALKKTVYKQITPMAFGPGDVIKVAWTIGVGTPTGQGEVEIYAEEDPDVPENESNMIASA